MQEIIEEQYQQTIIKKIIYYEISGKVFYITFNRPKRSNSFTNGMYKYFTELLDTANKNDSITTVVIQSKGKHFTGGNDLANFQYMSEIDDPKVLRNLTDELSKSILQKLQDTLINMNKLTVALVQGSAIGFGFSMLPLLDFVFITKQASFEFPLLQIAQCPEMCSSITFPQIFGKAKAYDYIFTGRKIPAEEICQTNLVTKMFDNQDKMVNYVQNEFLKNLQDLDDLAIKKAKHQLTRYNREQLLQASQDECQTLGEMWSRKDEIFQAVMKRMQKPKL